MMCSRCGRAEADRSTGFCALCLSIHKLAKELQKKYLPA